MEIKWPGLFGKIQQRSMQRVVKMLFCGESWGKIDHFCYWGDRNFIEVDVGD